MFCDLCEEALESGTPTYGGCGCPPQRCRKCTKSVALSRCTLAIASEDEMGHPLVYRANCDRCNQEISQDFIREICESDDDEDGENRRDSRFVGGKRKSIQRIYGEVLHEGQGSSQGRGRPTGPLIEDPSRKKTVEEEHAGFHAAVWMAEDQEWVLAQVHEYIHKRARSQKYPLGPKYTRGMFRYTFTKKGRGREVVDEDYFSDGDDTVVLFYTVDEAKHMISTVERVKKAKKDASKNRAKEASKKKAAGSNINRKK